MREDIYSDDHRRLREILKRQRLAAGLRQSDVADRTGRSQAYISKFENGELRLDVVDFVLLCETIGCDPHLILDESFGRQLGKPEQRRAALAITVAERPTDDPGQPRRPGVEVGMNPERLAVINTVRRRRGLPPIKSEKSSE